MGAISLRLAALWAAVGAVLLLGCSCVAAAAAQAGASPSDWRAAALDRQARGDYGNLAPLIAVLTNPCEAKGCPSRAIVSGPVVDWLASAGARVVPLRYYASRHEKEEVLRSVNGLMFPGGSGDLQQHSEYSRGAREALEIAMRTNDEGNLFPVQAICLGFELLHALLSHKDGHELMVSTDAESQADGLNLTSEAADSVYFRTLPASLLEQLPDRSRPLTFNAHIWGIPPTMYDEVPELKDNLRILSTTRDRNGTEYVSTVEGRHYPFLATQWHPEKPPYEFVDETVPHARAVMDLTYHTAQSFVDLARLNTNKVPYERQVQLSIFNYQRTFTAASSNFPNFPDTMYWIDPLEQS